MNGLSRVLLVCDFDNTICPTGDAMAKGLAFPGISRENEDAIRRFMAEGGRFAVVTGRSFPAYRFIQPLVPTNCPTGLFNGAGLYDYGQGRYLMQRGMPESAFMHYHEIMDAFPSVAMEVFMWDERVYAVRPNDYAVRHQSFTRSPWQELHALEELRELPAKLLFEDEAETLLNVRGFITAQPWFSEYEAIFSTPNLLEFTARGADKGGAARMLAAMFGIAEEDLYCAGDQENDLSMLETAHEGFIPADCNPLLFDRGFTVVRPCTENSIADIVARLERKYL